MDGCLCPRDIPCQPPSITWFRGRPVRRGKAWRPGRGEGQLGEAPLIGTTPLDCLPLSPESNSGNPSKQGLIPKVTMAAAALYSDKALKPRLGCLSTLDLDRRSPARLRPPPVSDTHLCHRGPLFILPLSATPCLSRGPVTSLQQHPRPSHFQVCLADPLPQGRKKREQLSSPTGPRYSL